MELSLESALESKIKTGLLACGVCLGGHFTQKIFPMMFLMLESQFQGDLSLGAGTAAGIRT
jgi:hypothetical protein